MSWTSPDRAPAQELAGCVYDMGIGSVHEDGCGGIVKLEWIKVRRVWRAIEGCALDKRSTLSTAAVLLQTENNQVDVREQASSSEVTWSGDRQKYTAVS